MQLTKTLITLAMGLTVASALALPAADRLEVRADKKGGNNKANNCANAKKLAAGIDDNIKIQKQEQSNVADIEKIVNSNNVDQKKFDAAKKTLLTTIDDGIKIREANQKLADGNGAKDGLATVSKILERCIPSQLLTYISGCQGPGSGEEPSSRFEGN